MTSSIFPPRSGLAPCSLSTQLIASTTLVLPEPFGATSHVMLGSSGSVVAEAKDLKPLSVTLFRCTGGALQGQGRSIEITASAPRTPARRRVPHSITRPRDQHAPESNRYAAPTKVTHTGDVRLQQR